MLVLIVAESKTVRATQRSSCEVLSKHKGEVVVIDDSTGGVVELEQYIYPSLFTIGTPLVHARFVLSGENISTELVSKLIASPTFFLLEEFSLPAPLVTTLKKKGAIVHLDKTPTPKQIKSDIFAATKILTATNKKDRWLAYQYSIGEHPIEAILGILYWKVRDLLQTSSDKKKWQEYYQALLMAHAQAWQTGAPLTLAIEKVILTK